MKSGLMIVALVALLSVVGLVMTSATQTGMMYIREDARNIGEQCGPSDRCLAGYTCMGGICRVNSGQMEILPGQLCTSTTPCKFGYGCIEGRCRQVR